MTFIVYGFQVFVPLTILTIEPVLKRLKPLPRDIPGGEIIRDPGMGVLCDAAATLVEFLSPNKTEEERTSSFKLTMKDLNSVGLVGVHEAGVFPETIKLYKKYVSLELTNKDLRIKDNCHFEYMQWRIVLP
jgi:predicted amidohydrolase YtcJ